MYAVCVCVRVCVAIIFSDLFSDLFERGFCFSKLLVVMLFFLLLLLTYCSFLSVNIDDVDLQ